jgi:ABC-2 type transport system ATP-binding protein
VSVLLDASAQHAGRTGREILTIAQRFIGLPRSRVEEMLDVVSLTSEESHTRLWAPWGSNPQPADQKGAA